ncbi:MAG: 50S ribosomal protein L32 [Deltaproteobacteria bacterium]|nr:50S ribosomal protein L32 [Deltaproteobacteria bacterium]
MAVPKRKTSKSKRDKRRSHDALAPQFGSTCAQCGATIMPHRVCKECGYYKGRQVLSV